MELASILILLTTGVVVGFGQGLLGIGGAFIMVPVMIAVFDHSGIAPDTAVKMAFGTSLAAIFPAAVATTLSHQKRGIIWWKPAFVIGLVSVSGSLLGAMLTTRFISVDILKIAFGVVVILAGIRLLIAKPTEPHETPEENVLLWALFGLLIGMFSGVLGVGGGILMVPVMTTMFRFPIHRAIATSAAVMIFTSAAGAAGYLINGLHASGLPAYSLGYLSLTAWLCLVPTSITITYVSTSIVHRLSPRILRTIFVILMMLVGLRMVGAF